MLEALYNKIWSGVKNNTNNKYYCKNNGRSEKKIDIK